MSTFAHGAVADEPCAHRWLRVVRLSFIPVALGGILLAVTDSSLAQHPQRHPIVTHNLSQQQDGDWVRLIELAKRYDASYIEIYPPDLMPLDQKHRIVEAFTGDGKKEGILGYRPWLARRARVQYVREGTLQQTFARSGGAARVAQLAIDARAPAETRVDWRCRTRRSGEAAWSQWSGPAQVDRLPAGDEAMVEVRLHTDDGHVTPAVGRVQVVWE